MDSAIACINGLNNNIDREWIQSILQIVYRETVLLSLLLENIPEARIGISHLGQDSSYTALLNSLVNLASHDSSPSIIGPDNDNFLILCNMATCPNPSPHQANLPLLKPHEQVIYSLIQSHDTATAQKYIHSLFTLASRTCLMGVVKECRGGECTSLACRMTALARLGDLYTLTEPAMAKEMYRFALKDASDAGWTDSMQELREKVANCE